MAGQLEPTNSSSMSRLQFPSHYDAESGHWMSFTRMKYNRTAALAKDELTLAEGGKTINLPIPAQLAKGYGAMWDDVSLGVLGNEQQRIVGDFIQSSASSFRNGNSMWGSLKEGLTNTGTWENGKNYVQAAAVSQVTDNELFKFAGKSTGYARNPFKSVLFNSVNFRQFSFNFVLVANSYGEAIVIREIIKQFNTGMSPAIVPNTMNSVYAYPDVFQIKFEKPEFLFKLAPCILTDFMANYHNEGNALYFTNSETQEKIPASVSLDLTFKEISVLTKDDFENGGY